MPSVENSPQVNWVLDWEELVFGERVALRYKDGKVLRGSVDGMTGDGRILWFLPDWPGSRHMIHVNDGHRIWKL